jgi:hypothetical protein
MAMVWLMPTKQENQKNVEAAVFLVTRKNPRKNQVFWAATKMKNPTYPTIG